VISLSTLLLLAAAHASGPPAGVAVDSVDFRVVPHARTAGEAHETWAARREAVLWALALREIPAIYDREHGGSRLPTIALARLEVGHRTDEVNEFILRPTTRVYAEAGTDFHALGPFCAREGDYDFALRAWMPVLYRFWNRPDRLWPDARRKLLHELSPARGNKPEKWRFFCGVPIPETENHILMTESSRLLTNQLLQRERREAGLAPAPEWDNDQNGMNAWMRAHLTQFLRHDFEEFNSKPYQPYAVMPIQNLYEYAEDARVREIARGVLDYLSAKYAASSDRLRRLAPFRRNGKNRRDPDLIARNGEAGRMLALTGNASILRDWRKPWIWDFDLDFAHYPLLGQYRLPALVEDLLFRRDGNSAYQRVRHFVAEIYARSPDFLISGGGVFRRSYPVPFLTPNDAYAMPTLLIPNDGGVDASRLIRIEGHRKDAKKNNLCVAPGFACGLNPVIPDTLPPGCVARREGAWTFVDYSARGCPLGYNLRAAVYSADCDTKACRKGGGRFGFFEAAPADGPVEGFIRRVLAANGATRFRSGGTNLYVTSDGRRIEFEPNPRSRALAGIVSIDGAPEQREWRDWSFAEGDVIRADGEGQVELRNPATGESIVIDVTDPERPWRSDS
jgi:hypothetical protein